MSKHFGGGVVVTPNPGPVYGPGSFRPSSVDWARGSRGAIAQQLAFVLPDCQVFFADHVPGQVHVMIKVPPGRWAQADAKRDELAEVLRETLPVGIVAKLHLFSDTIPLSEDAAMAWSEAVLERDGETEAEVVRSALDQVAMQFAVTRQPGESDDQLRHRLKLMTAAMPPR